MNQQEVDSMSLSLKIEKHLGREIDFATEIIINDGEIVKWGVEEAQPPLDELEKIDVTTELASMKFITDRVNSYPRIKDQLDMLFHDMTAGKGTKDGEWYKAVAKVKTDNPKPTE